MGGTDLLTKTDLLIRINHMGAGNTAEGLCQHHVGTAVHDTVGLEGSLISGHSAGQVVITHIGNSNI